MLQSFVGGKRVNDVYGDPTPGEAEDYSLPRSRFGYGVRPHFSMAGMGE
jgi:hypothetical protein